MRAKRALETIVLNQAARTNKQVLKLITLINDEFHAIQNLEREIAQKRREIERMQESLAARRLKKNQAIVDGSLAILELNMAENDIQLRVGPHEIFMEDMEDERRRRDYRANAAEIARYMEYMYATDNVAPVDEDMLNEVEELIRHRAGQR